MKLSRSGLGVLAAGVLLAAFGIRWRYVELMVLGAVAVVAVATAWLTVHRPVGLEVSPRGMPRRVARGGTIPCRVRVQNNGHRPLPPVVLVDTILDDTAETFLSGVGAGAERPIDYELPARHRGVHTVGPLYARRQDLLGLVTYERSVGPIEEVLVHPRVLDLSGSRGVDHVTDLETQLRRSTQDPLAGFQSLRQYVRGDDTRTIHWPSSARTGYLVVREFVDARRPRLTVVLDTSVAAHAPDGFEEAVDVAASLTAHAIAAGLDVVLRTNDRQHRGDPMPVRSMTEMLDLLARVVATVGDETLPFAPLVTLDSSGDTVVVVTGPHGAFPRLPQLTERLQLVRIGANEGFQRVGVLGARDAAGFQRAWATGVM